MAREKKQISEQTDPVTQERPERPKRRAAKSVMANLSVDPSSPAQISDRVRAAKYALGDIVRHRLFPFRGVIFDVDPVFNNTEEWYQAIPAHVRPRKDQPFYHLLARNADATYQAYVSEQNLLADAEGGPVAHPLIDDIFEGMSNGRYNPRPRLMM